MKLFDPHELAEVVLEYCLVAAASNLYVANLLHVAQQAQMAKFALDLFDRAA
jgi:hypothetical protein